MSGKGLSFCKCDRGQACESALNKDPAFGVIGIQSGPPGRRVHSGFRGDAGARLGMLVVETIAKIRRAYFAQNKPIKPICRELRVSRKVVRKVIRSRATEFRLSGAGSRCRGLIPGATSSRACCGRTRASRYVSG
jgi:hypothetical protein